MTKNKARCRKSGACHLLEPPHLAVTIGSTVDASNIAVEVRSFSREFSLSTCGVKTLREKWAEFLRFEV